MDIWAWYTRNLVFISNKDDRVQHVMNEGISGLCCTVSGFTLHYVDPGVFLIPRHHSHLLPFTLAVEDETISVH